MPRQPDRGMLAGGVYPIHPAPDASLQLQAPGRLQRSVRVLVLIGGAWVDGRLDMVRPQYRLVDRLNDAGLPVILAGAVLSPGGSDGAGAATAQLGAVALNRTAIRLVVALEDLPHPSGDFPPDRVVKTPRHALLVVGGTQVDGTVHLPGVLDLDALVSPHARLDHFIVCTGAAVGGPSAERHGVVLVARGHIDAVLARQP